MNDKYKELLNLLNDQKEIFGDYLFEEIVIDTSVLPVQSSKNNIVSDTVNSYNINSQNVEESNNYNSLTDFENAISNCQKCSLGKSRDKFVFGSGNSNADVMIIGEAPGADEDKQGKPFVGRAGKLLTDILKAINFERDEVFIANILKCRPPSNRNPLPEEMNECTPYLYKQIEMIKPKVILCLGLVAAHYLIDDKLSLTKMRGNTYEIKGVKQW
ncbi:MAG: uracil-DNA glycosylase [Melioribacteraceae bacterium]